MKMREIKEIKSEIIHFEGLLKDPELDFTSQTWIELQLMELRKELREANREKKLKTNEDGHS